MAIILIVDDDTDILKFAQKVLSQAGHTTFVAEDAIKAMDLLKTYTFDLVVSDANMPHYSGFEFIQTLRKDPRYQQIPIAMLTGLREKKDIEKAISCGADDYIVKPIDPLIFLQKIETLFAKKPPSQHPEAYLSHQYHLSEMKISCSVKAHSVSELGVKVLSPFAIPPGSSMELQGAFFEEINTTSPPLKVLSCEFNSELKAYSVHLIFLGARENFLQKIRRWIFSHGQSNRPAA